MKLVLMALALAATSFSQADTITRSFDLNSSDLGSFYGADAAAENVQIMEPYSSVSASVTEAGDMVARNFRGYIGEANTTSTWSNSFISSGGSYSASLNFASSGLENRYWLTDNYIGADFGAGYRWSLYANNNLVWNSGVSFSAQAGAPVVLSKSGADLGGQFLEEADYYDEGVSNHHFVYWNVEQQLNVALGSFAQGAVVDVRYVLETYSSMNNYSCNECATVVAQVGDPFQIGNAPPAIQIAAVPEPETYALFGLGLLGVAVARRRKNA